MKKLRRKNGLILSLIFAGSILITSQARATPELDRQYSLETVGFLRAWDNVDGLFADYVAAAYKDYFSRQSRFVLQDLSKADNVLTHSKLSYQKVIQDDEVLGQLARATRSQSVIRTKILKEGPEYHFTIDWLHAPKMDVMATETFVLKQPTEGSTTGMGDVRGEMEKALEKLVAKLPFQGHITGRDNASVTVNIGLNSNLKPGDTLLISTLDEVKKHPLLMTIVDWRLTPVGKVQITEVDEGIAFGKVVEEEQGHQIARYQKIVQIIPKPAPPNPPVVNEFKEAVDMNEIPKLGWVRGGAFLGSFSRDYAQVANASTATALGRRGGGLALGAEAESQLWLNREWFTELGFATTFGGYGQTDTVTGLQVANLNSSEGLFAFKIDVGYTYLVTGEFFGPKGWLKLGYHSISYTLAINAFEGLAPTSFKGLFLGVGGELPIRSNFGAILNLDFGLLTGVSETGGISGEGSGATDVDVFAGGYYRLNNRMTVRAGFDVKADSANFAGNGGTSLSQKTVTFAPSLLYYF